MDNVDKNINTTNSDKNDKSGVFQMLSSVFNLGSTPGLAELRRDVENGKDEALKSAKEVSEQIYRYLALGIDIAVIARMLKMLDIDLNKIILNIEPDKIILPTRSGQNNAPFIDVYFRFIKDYAPLKSQTLDYIIEHTPKEQLKLTLLHIIKQYRLLNKDDISAKSIDKLVQALDCQANLPQSDTFIYEYITIVDAFAKNEKQYFSDEHLVKIIRQSPCIKYQKGSLDLKNAETIMSYIFKNVAFKNLKNRPLIWEAIFSTMPTDSTSIQKMTIAGIGRGLEGIGILNKIDARHNTKWVSFIEPIHLGGIGAEIIMYLVKHKDYPISEEAKRVLEKRQDWAKISQQIEKHIAQKDKWSIYRELREGEKQNALLTNPNGANSINGINNGPAPAKKPTSKI